MTNEISRRAIVPVLAGGALCSCAALRPGVLGEGARDIAYGSHARQRMDIYIPKDSTSPRPVVFFIYGGSWANGAKEDYAFFGDALGPVTVASHQSSRLLRKALFS